MVSLDVIPPHGFVFFDPQKPINSRVWVSHRGIVLFRVIQALPSAEGMTWMELAKEDERYAQGRTYQLVFKKILPSFIGWRAIGNYVPAGPTDKYVRVSGAGEPSEVHPRSSTLSGSTDHAGETAERIKKWNLVLYRRLKTPSFPPWHNNTLDGNDTVRASIISNPWFSKPLPPP